MPKKILVVLDDNGKISEPEPATGVLPGEAGALVERVERAFWSWITSPTAEVLYTD